MRMRSFLCVLGVAGWMFGCGGPGNADGGDASTADMVSTDVPIDMGGPDVRDVPAIETGPSRLYMRCNSNAECGAGLTCNLNYPGGLCTQRCTTDRACGNNGICAGQNGCLPACMAGADDCATYSGLCFIFDNAAPDRRACFPGCYTMPPMGFPACNMGRACNPYSGSCEVDPMPMGADNGEPCTTNADCRGRRCRLETTDMPAAGTPTGYLNGYCASVTRRPDGPEFVRDMPLPRSGCPMGSVVIPFSGESVGDPVWCWDECRMDSDCRGGYYCNRVIPTGMTMPVYASGGCYPINCLDAGRTCPAGFTCVTRMVGTPPRNVGYCGRVAGDGGVTDAGGDASPTDSGGDSSTSDVGATDVGATDVPSGG